MAQRWFITHKDLLNMTPAKSWGTPPDIIEHHSKQIMNMLSRLKSK